MAKSTTPPQQSLAENHTAELEASAISIEVARRAGIYTAEETSQLPKSLQHLETAAPGWVMPRQSTLEDGEGKPVTVATVKPDSPREIDGRVLKYDSAPGAGGHVFVHPDQRHLIGKARAVLLVEGEKKMLSVLSTLGTDTDKLVLGMSGCWGWSVDKKASPALDAGLLGAEELFVVLDADVRANRAVWDAGDRLRRHAAATVKKVRFVHIPAGGDAGIDDVLATFGGDRREYLLGLLRSAAGIGRRPPAQKVARPKIAPGRMQVSEDGVSTGREIPTIDEKGEPTGESKWEEAMPAGVVITRITEIEDDLQYGGEQSAPGVLYDIDFKRYRGEEEARELVRVSRKEVPGYRMQTLSATLREIGADATTVQKPASRIEQDEIHQAILETGSNLIPERALERTGYVTLDGGRPGYLTRRGVLTSSGLDTRLRSRVDETYGFDIPDTTEMTTKKVREAWVRGLSFADDRFARPEVPVLSTGYLAYVLTGDMPKGSLAFVGQIGSGKTVALSWVAAHISSNFAPHDILTGTKKGLARSGRGLHQALLCLDDAKPRQEAFKDGAEDGLAAQMRRAYNGPREDETTLGAGEDRKGVSARWGGHYGLVVSAEGLPESTGVGKDPNESTRERTLAIGVPAESSLLTSAPGGGDPEELFIEHARSGVQRIQTGSYLTLLMSWMEEVWESRENPDETHYDSGEERTPQAEFAIEVRERRNVARAEILKRAPELSNRTASVAAAFLAGYSLWMEAPLHYGAISEMDFRRFQREALDLVVETAREHRVRWLAPAQAQWAKVIVRLQGMAASGTHVININPECFDDDPKVRAEAKWRTRRHKTGEDVEIRSELLGKAAKVSGVEVVALIPEAVAKALGTPQETLERVLDTRLVRSESGETRTQVRFGSQRSWCWLISREVWSDPLGIGANEEVQDGAAEVQDAA